MRLVITAGKQSVTNKNGQAMILTVLALGGSILGATAIAGMLMVYQFRQAADLSLSSVAIYAADAGVEWGWYKFFRGGDARQPVFTNQASVSVTCFDAGESVVDCSNNDARSVRAIGKVGEVSRALESALIFWQP